LKEQSIFKMENRDEPAQNTNSLSGPILELEKLIKVQDRYKALLPQLLSIFQKMYDEKDKNLLMDIQPLTMFIPPENGKGFKKVMDDIREYLNVVVKNSQNCRQRLASLRSVFLQDEQRQIINDALDLLNLPASSEITSDADFRLLSLQQFTKEMDVGIEIQEIFIFLNSLFSPVESQTPPPPSSQQSKNKRR
jgi:hypothetical protein